MVQAPHSRLLLGASGNDFRWRTPSSLSISIDDDDDIAVLRNLLVPDFPCPLTVATCGEAALGCKHRHFATRLYSLSRSEYRRGYDSANEFTGTQDIIWNNTTLRRDSTNSSLDAIPLRRCMSLTDLAVTSQEDARSASMCVGKPWPSTSSSSTSEGPRSDLADALVRGPYASRGASKGRFPECRLCLTGPLPPPQRRLCMCRGALAFAHAECVRAAGHERCPVCLHAYKFPRQINGSPPQITKKAEVLQAIFSGFFLWQMIMKWGVGAPPSARPQLRAVPLVGACALVVLGVAAALDSGFLAGCLLRLGDGLRRCARGFGRELDLHSFP